MIGEKLGAYAVTAKISEGGMGVVYRAEHSILGRTAAIKVLLPTYSQNRDVVQRFFNEARATTTIKHPGIVEIYDFGYHDDGRAYIVMELLAGESLAARLKRVGVIDEDSALLLVRGMASALAAAHDAGIIHRDLKPDNVFLVPDPDLPGGERPKLLDFGIAKLSGNTGQVSSATRTGMLMGTPAYMAPEQCRGAGDVDPRTDLYALGCIFHEMVCGYPPFTAEGAGEVMGKHMFVAPLPPRQFASHLSAESEAIILRLLAKEPGDRYASARQLAYAVGELARARAGAAWPVAQVTPGPYVAVAATAPTTLGGAASAVGTPPPASVAPVPLTQPPASRRWTAIGASAAAATLVLTLVGWRVFGGSSSSSDEIAPAPAAAAAPEPRPEPVASPTATPMPPPNSPPAAPPPPSAPPPVVVEATPPPPVAEPVKKKPPPSRPPRPHPPVSGNKPKPPPTIGNGVYDPFGGK